MEYRTFKTIKTSPSLLGYGTMRLPIIDGDNNVINEEETFRLLDYAYNHGITYYDTAYFYHGGNSETVLGKWIKTIDRSKILVTTKSPFWLAKDNEGFDALLEEQMTKLNVDYLDFYLLHAVNAERLECIKQMDLLKHLPSLKNSGKVKHLGFSFHDNYEVFEELLMAYQWDFCQIQFNYMDENYQAGIKGLKLAEKLGIPVVIMEPIRGGLLANVPDEINNNFRSVRPDLSPAAWALRWVANHQNVLCVLSGMSSFDQVEENINTFNQLQSLSIEEDKAIEFAKQYFNSRMKVKCTNCSYCMPCPHGVNIPGNFAIYNSAFIYDNASAFKGSYLMQAEAVRSTSCKDCKICLTKCPQHINIPSELKKVSSLFNK